MAKLDKLEPKRVFYYFEEITKIPRCSFEEEKIANYLENFAKDHNLECIRDKFNNIIIKKPATVGYENSPSLIIQGHMDMVCEKNESCNIDFSKDSIKFEVEDNLIISRDTTLGADNGIAVAMALAILEDESIKHPPLEILITTNEENGMTGAKGVDGSLLDSKMLLNLDSETEGVACIACSGGQRDYLIFDKEFDSLSEDKKCFELSITGLNGGHSGQDIGKGLGNSNKLLARALLELNNNFDINLIDIFGGAKPNAIPRLAKAKIAVNESDIKNIQNSIVKLNKEFMRELIKVDANVRLNFEKIEFTNVSFTNKLKDNIINLLNILPNGIQSMSQDIENLVGCSVNVGVIESTENEIRILTNIRAALMSQKQSISEIHKICAKITGARYEIQSQYPAWEYKEESHIREVADKAYKELTGKPLIFEAIHAGLECGIFKETIGDIDMLSIGPNIHGVHAPGENIEIESTKNVYEFLLKLLENLK